MIWRERTLLLTVVFCLLALLMLKWTLDDAQAARQDEEIKELKARNAQLIELVEVRK